LKKEHLKTVLIIAAIAAGAFLVYSIIKSFANGAATISGVIAGISGDLGSFWTTITGGGFFGISSAQAAQNAQTNANIASVGALLGQQPPGVVPGTAIPIVANPDDNSISSIIGNYDPATGTLSPVYFGQ
jgi:hypothetical protein